MADVPCDDFWDLLGSFGPGSLIVDCTLGLRSRPILPVVDRSACEISALADVEWLSAARGRQLDAVLTFVDEFRQRYLSMRGLLRTSVHVADIAEAAPVTQQWIPFGGGGGAGMVALKICPVSAELWSLTGARTSAAWRFEAGHLIETAPRTS